MSSRISLLFQMTTAPEQPSIATARSAGWSESVWFDGPNLPSSALQIRDLANARAKLLPTGAAIVGFRIGNYTITGNKIFPTGSATGKFFYPGQSSYPTGLPQKALEVIGDTPSGANKARWTLRCLPDQMIVGGEYSPTAGFTANVRLYFAQIQNLAWAFLGRDLDHPAIRVSSIVNGFITTPVDFGAGQDYFIRFSRVYDTQGNSVRGAFRVGPLADGKRLLHGFPTTITVQDSGTARIDELKIFNIGTMVSGRATTRKVGRPFAGFRGRQSNR